MPNRELVSARSTRDTDDVGVFRVGTTLPASATVSRAVVEDADGYERSVHGVRIQSVRTARGAGPNTVLAVTSDRFVVTAVAAGFPMVNRTTIGDDRFLAAVVRSTPLGGRWCDIDLEPGTVVIFGPGAEHVGVNPAGIRFAFVAVELEVIEEIADGIGASFAPPLRGQVAALRRSPQASALGSTLSAHVEAAASGVSPSRTSEDDLLHRVTTALSVERETPRIGLAQRNSRIIAATSVEYAESIQRIPSIQELCLAAHVSERRLRTAFSDTYGVSPTRFFRLWALNQARHRLVRGDPTHESVTQVALELGMRHLSRFAGSYKTVYGEAPRTTLWHRSNVP